MLPQKKFSSILGMLSLIMFLGAYYVYYIAIISKTNTVQPSVKQSVRAVLFAKYRSEVTGGYWENEMEEQAVLVAKMPLVARLDFYRSIILYFDLDASRGIAFLNLVGVDAKALAEHLQSFKSDPRYTAINDRQRKILYAWSNEMQRYASTRTEVMTQ